MNIENFKQDILNTYKDVINKGLIGKNGYYPSHDALQNELYKLAEKYNLKCVLEYSGRLFFDKEKQRMYRGRMDLVYYLNNIPYISLEIDSGLKKTSIKKLLANTEFKYKIWFCYNNKANTQEYYNLINKYDPDKDIIHITP